MKPKSVGEYMDTFSREQKTKLIELHTIIRATLPETDEALKWGSPATIDKDGMILIIFSGHKQHINLVVTPSKRQALENDLVNYETGKGSVKLSYDKPLPVALIKKIIRYRAEEYRKYGVGWM